MTRGANDRPSYTDLLTFVQPRSIKSDEEASTIQRHIDALIDREKLSDDEQELLALLGDLILAWESGRHGLPEISPAQAIRALLEAHALRQSALVGPVFPTKSIASEILSGKRSLTYEHVSKLAQFFRVSPAIFYPAEHSAVVA